MASETEVPMLAEYFILSLTRLDRVHCQRIEAVRSVTGDDMAYYLFAPNVELEDLILDYFGFPADGASIKGGGKFSRNASGWEYGSVIAARGEHFAVGAEFQGSHVILMACQDYASGVWICQIPQLNERMKAA